MKKIIFFTICLVSFYLSAQQVISNKGNRNQSYPVVTETKNEIVNLINDVSQNNIESSIRYMQQFLRGSKTPELLIVQNWLIERFESYGYQSKDIYVHDFTINGEELLAGNIVVTKEGTEFPDEYIMISSHYDHSTGNSLVGPGADDNASGTAGVLECARLLKSFPTKRSIIFVPFSGEEYWMEGSLPFVKKCASEDMNIIAHFNMDMIGWFPPDNPITIMASGYSEISKALFEYYHQTANTYIPSIPTIRLSDGDSYGGDHMPFNMYEYPSLYIGDTEFQNPCYHQPCDTIGEFGGVNRLDLARAFVKAVLASTAELVNAWLPPQNVSASSGIDKITVSWNGDSKATSYKIFKNNEFLTETTNNFYEDKNVELGQKYEYYVIALNNEKQTAPSNKDAVTFVAPLQLPYISNFGENKYGFEQSDWVLRTANGKPTICNTSGSGLTTDNYLSFAELDWFPIPEDTKNITVRFKWAGTLIGIWSKGNTSLFFEVTKDRKTWDKLAGISGYSNSLKNCEFSLAKYIGSDFFQARFRLESSGAKSSSYTKIGYITDFEIVFESDTTSVKENLPYISLFNFTPNPASTYISITTNQQEPYRISIFDMNGKIIFTKDGFSDGILSTANLSRGNYFVVASTKHHRVAKKLVIQ